MFKKISRDKLTLWLAELKGQFQVFIPTKENGLWTYGQGDGQAFLPQFKNSRVPPKGLFLESPRPLIGWKNQGGKTQVSSFPPLEACRVILGLRPCDARAVRLLEPVFAGDLEDVFFLGNLCRTLLVGEACRVQCSGSFCREMGIDPQDSADCDIFFRDTGAGKIGKAVSEKGKALIEGNPCFEEGSPTEWDSAQDEIKGGRERLLFDLKRVKARAVERFPDEELWRQVSAKCINCGICTYLCPTCHCFDLCDLQIPGQGVRLRCWDSCAFPSFTQMTMHNPREEKWRRYRQRVSHKFHFFPQNFQTVACVGCGRCVAYCPVNLDLREVLLEVSR